MTETTIFLSNRSQAVRLPKPVAFPADVTRVEIVKQGRTRIITPVGNRWDDFFNDTPLASDDFMTDRDQPAPEDREAL